MSRMRIGLVGFGAIGQYLVQTLDEDSFFVFDADASKAKDALKKGGFKSAEFVDSLAALKKRNPELVVEAAAQEAVPGVLPFLEICDVMVMSVGAFTHESWLKTAQNTAEKYRHRLYLPSGAVGGLDVLSACEPKSVLLETRKNPKSLGRHDAKERTIFEGSAREACNKYPKNVNVAANLSLAGIGFDKTRVKIISDPEASSNTHTVLITGNTGKYQFVFQNRPFEKNPKTSALAAQSAVALIRKIKGVVQVG